MSIIIAEILKYAIYFHHTVFSRKRKEKNSKESVYLTQYRQKQKKGTKIVPSRYYSPISLIHIILD